MAKKKNDVIVQNNSSTKYENAQNESDELVKVLRTKLKRRVRDVAKRGYDVSNIDENLETLDINELKNLKQDLNYFYSQIEYILPDSDNKW